MGRRASGLGQLGGAGRLDDDLLGCEVDWGPPERRRGAMGRARAPTRHSMGTASGPDETQREDPVNIFAPNILGQKVCVH